jgi:hypothetical protein
MTTGLLVKSPIWTSTVGSATTRPAYCSPTNAIRSPIPTAMACLRESGTPATSLSQAPNRESRINTEPEMKTAPSATCQE